MPALRKKQVTQVSEPWKVVTMSIVCPGHESGQAGQVEEPRRRAAPGHQTV
jgi:hypothetical protein